MTTTEQPATVLTETDETIVDIKLFKTIKLYRILCPADRGGIGERTRRAWLTVMWSFTVYVGIQLAWQLSVLPDIKQTVQINITLMYVLVCFYKNHAILRHGSRLWDLLDAGRFAFTACGLRHPATMLRCRDTVSRVLLVYVTVYFVTACTWVLSPLFLNEYVPVTHVDGTVGRYRATVFNTWFPLPEHVHNSVPGWTAMYAVELVINFYSAFNAIIFDSYVITMCVVLSSQSRIMSASYETLGHRLSRSPTDGSLDGFLDMPSESAKEVHYRDLIRHIRDTQKIMKKYDEFLDVLRLYIKTHVLNCSFALIGFIFLFCAAFFVELSTINVDCLRLLSTLITQIVLVYTYCYGCDSVETARSSLNFGLYSCNWTEMDLKFQKTVLLAMAMNSAHNKTMHITPNHAINLEFFFRVIKTSFSVVPVLLQLNAKNKR